jgi:intracellular sulfur oxidation DsrE/DsrF family protein
MFARGMLRWMAVAAVALAAVVNAQQPAPPQNRVVVQVSDADPAKWNLALNNARNLQADLGAKNVEIEIVAYGPGIGMLRSESIVGNRVGDALGAGENTMHAQKLVKADMLDGIGYVGAGVVEIMQRQQQGWAYLRP